MSDETIDWKATALLRHDRIFALERELLETRQWADTLDQGRLRALADLEKATAKLTAGDGMLASTRDELHMRIGWAMSALDAEVTAHKATKLLLGRLFSQKYIEEGWKP